MLQQIDFCYRVRRDNRDVELVGYGAGSGIQLPLDMQGLSHQIDPDLRKSEHKWYRLFALTPGRRIAKAIALHSAVAHRVRTAKAIRPEERRCRRQCEDLQPEICEKTIRPRSERNRTSKAWRG